MEIAALSYEHEAALRDFKSEFAAAGEDRIPGFLSNPEWTFAQIVQGFDDQSHGKGLPQGWVPATTRFLIHDSRIIGLFNLRHRLTDGLHRSGGHVGYSVRPSERRKGYGTKLLTAAMELARIRGMDRLLVTCHPNNVASAGVIENCGGVLQALACYEPIHEEVCRYWISI